MAVESVGLIVRPEIPWLRYSADGIVPDNFLIEIKCPVAGKTKPLNMFIGDLKFLEEIAGDITLKSTHKYCGQVQLGMFLTGLKSTQFIIYSKFEDEVAIFEVPFNKAFAQKMIGDL